VTSRPSGLAAANADPTVAYVTLCNSYRTKLSPGSSSNRLLLRPSIFAMAAKSIGEPHPGVFTKSPEFARGVGLDHRISSFVTPQGARSSRWPRSGFKLRHMLHSVKYVVAPTFGKECYRLRPRWNGFVSHTILLGTWSAVIDDLDAPVLRFLHAIGGRDQQVAFALGHDLDFR